MKKSYNVLLSIVVGVSIVGVGVYLFLNKQNKRSEDKILTKKVTIVKEPNVQKIAEGLTYTIDKEGDSKEVARKGSLVKVHYTGYLRNSDGTKGKQFDSSRTRGVPFEFPLGGGMVINGWDLGVEGMKKGEIRTLTIESQYAYGDRGFPGAIPPKATLIFEVEFLGS